MLKNKNKKTTLPGPAKSMVHTLFIPIKLKINNDTYENIKLLMYD